MAVSQFSRGQVVAGGGVGGDDFGDVGRDGFADKANVLRGNSMQFAKSYNFNTFPPPSFLRLESA